MNVLESDLKEDGRADLTLRLSNSLSELKRIVDALYAMKERYSLSERDFLTARLCAEEVFTNIVRHGFFEGDGREVYLRIEADADSIRMHFQDNGKPFDPLATSPTRKKETLETALAGGRGISLIRAYAQELRYAYQEGYNSLSLTIRRELRRA